jgi:hypothetical protein
LLDHRIASDRAVKLLMCGILPLEQKRLNSSRRDLD